MKRIVAQHGSDLVQYFGSEDGKHYRGFYQRAEPLLAHAKRLNDTVNTAPVVGNPNGWKYAGSVAIGTVIDWCKRTGCTFDQWARNEGGIKDQFLRWYKSEFSKMMPTQGASARPSIVVPQSYRVRTRDAVTNH